jgi:hypothetical protein
VSVSDGRDRRDPGVTSEQLAAYLQDTHWFEDGKIRSVATIWHRHEEANAEAEVVVPLHSAKDYRQRMREALSAVSSFENREILDVLNDVKRLFSNVITVRVIHADTTDGTIPINDGVLLISKAKDLLLAAAQSIYSKKKQFLGTPKEAREYLETILLGQTEVGSYVVNVIAPIQSGSIVEQVTAAQVPLAQAIASNLVTGLEALEKASDLYDEGGTLRVFDEAVQAGASANMCDALLGFSGEKRNRTFEITVTASPGPLFESQPKRFEFDAKHVELLEKASGYYKDDYVLPQRTLVGYIRKLSRPKDETSGTVTMQAQVSDVERSVRMELTGDDYHMAVIAHDKSELVKVDGDVHIKSKTARLMNPTNFGVIKVQDLF